MAFSERRKQSLQRPDLDLQPLLASRRKGNLGTLPLLAHARSRLKLCGWTLIPRDVPSGSWACGYRPFEAKGVPPPRDGN